MTKFASLLIIVALASSAWAADEKPNILVILADDLGDGDLGCDNAEAKVPTPNPESRTEREREREKLLRAGGRELLGDKGLNCVACHNFNGKAALINQGIDLLTSYQRLQPGWLNSYLRNPGAFRPRTVMPTA